MNVLFLCTGNYYRSRFAEAYFNVLVKSKGLLHRAGSRGLAAKFDTLTNPGSISAAALAELKKLGIEVASPIRPPEKLFPQDSANYDLFVCLDKEEHQPLVLGRGGLDGKRIVYWNIKDLDREPPESAMARCRRCVEDLVAALQAEDGARGPRFTSADE